MKKNILSVLTVMLILVSLVSCDMFNMGESGATKGLASISFVESDGTKALSASTDAASELITSSIWWYKATKTDGGPDQGAKATWTRVNDSTGLDGVLTGFSVGEWKFILGYATKPEVGDDPTTPSSEITAEGTLEAGKVNYITANITLTQTSGSNKTLIFDRVILPAKDSDENATVKWTYSLDGGDNFSEISYPDGDFEDAEETVLLKELTSLSETSCDVVIRGVFSKNGKNTVRKGEITVQLYDDLTTTITGSIDDLTTTVEFVGNVYQLSYDANITDDSTYTGNLPAATMVGGYASVASGSLSRAGIEFLGWNTEADATGDTYKAGDTIVVKADTVLYAMWNYHVTYDKNGATSGTAPVDSKVYNGGTKATVLAQPDSLEKEGCIFLGWNTKEDGTGTFYQAEDEVVFNANITLYAQWKDITKGKAAVSSSAGRTNNECDWVQLWEDGPRFATFNIAATINTYKNATTTDTATLGGTYTWGGTKNFREVDIENDSYNKDLELTAQNDTATQIWGSNWKMPTKNQLQALLENCDVTWCNGTSVQYESGCTLTGYKVSGKEGTVYADNSIFLPAAGISDCSDGDEIYIGDLGLYWSTTPETVNHNAYYLQTEYTRNIQKVDYTGKANGLSVRAVLVEE